MWFAPQAILLLGAGVVVWALWRSAQGRALFVIKIVKGEPRSTAGTVTRAFLGEVREIAALHGVMRGRVAGVQSGTQIRLEFSDDFPQAGRQQLRNWWGIHGWKAGKQLGPNRPRTRLGS